MNTQTLLSRAELSDEIAYKQSTHVYKFGKMPAMVDWAEIMRHYDSMADLIREMKAVLEEREWRDTDSCPAIHGKRFLAYNRDIGMFVAEYWEPTDLYVYTWNQKPCTIHLWQPLPKPPTGEPCE